VLKDPKRLSGSKSGWSIRHWSLQTRKVSHPRRDFFRQPPVSRIDDANHRCVWV